MTGISPGRWWTGQPTFADQLPRDVPLLHGAVVLGHNVRFDLSFLRRSSAGAGQEIDRGARRRCT